MSEKLSKTKVDRRAMGFSKAPPTIIPSLSELEKDGLGEIGNISMGSAATTLNLLLNQKVSITTPRVDVVHWKDLVETMEEGDILTKVRYKQGLEGSSILMLLEKDAKIICDLMMQGDGSNTSGPISELHISAIGEAMNQMIGSSSTSMAKMLNANVDIEPPQVYSKNFDDTNLENLLDEEMKVDFVRISFRLAIGKLVDSTIMQLFALPFAKDMFTLLMELNCSGQEAYVT